MFRCKELATAIENACKRFPAPLACCAALFALLWGWNHDVRVMQGDASARLSQWLWMTGVMGLSVKLWAEGRGIGATGQALGYALCASVAGVACFMTPHFSLAHVFFGAAIVLSVLFAPYAGGAADDDSFWYRAYLSSVAFSLGAVAALTLGVGLTAITASVAYLFEMDIPGRFYGDIWLFASLLFAPVVAFTYLPRVYTFVKQDCTVHGGVTFIANYVLVPLMLAYMGVLYGYTLRIVLMAELPRGNVAAMVTGFGALGVAVHVCIYALRDTGTAALRAYHAHFYKFMLVPLALLAVGLYVRIAAYGVTPERYAVGLALVWFCALAGAHVARRGRVPLKYVPMSLCALCLIASAGPLGVRSVSVRSQTAQLQTLLVKTGVLQANGAVVKASKPVAFETRKRISSILSFFFDVQAQEVLAPWVSPLEAVEKKKGAQAHDATGACGRKFFASCDAMAPWQVMHVWGMDYVDRWGRAHEDEDTTAEGTYQGFAFLGTAAGTWRKVSPYDYAAEIYAARGAAPWTRTLPLPDDAAGRAVLFTLDESAVLTLSLTGKDKRPPVPVLAFDMQKLVDALLAKKAAGQLKKSDGMFVLTKENAAGMAAKLIVTSVDGNVINGHVKIEHLSAQVLLTPSAP